MINAIRMSREKIAKDPDFPQGRIQEPGNDRRRFRLRISPPAGRRDQKRMGFIAGLG